MTKIVRIGSGSAAWVDRIEPARLNAEQGNLDYLCFETMAEATVSEAMVRSVENTNRRYYGYDPYLDARMQAVLPGCLRRGTKIITNQGWTDPEAAAERVVYWLREHGARGMRVAAVSGSVLNATHPAWPELVLETGQSVSTLGEHVISAEAYLGAESIVEALAEGADVVITGRVADPSLFLAPMIHEFRWRSDDYELVGKGAGLGHLLECGAHVTGGYFADPPYKHVDRLWDIAFPIAEVATTGSATITKIPTAGGCVNLRTVKEQLLYEVHDPANYITPDVIVDFTSVQLKQIGKDRVRVDGIRGKPPPSTLKVTVGCHEGFIGEDTFFYAGPGALDRARLAKRVLEERFRMIALEADELRIDFIGQNAVHGSIGPEREDLYEVGVRVAARAREHEEAAKIGREVDAIAISGIGMTAKHIPFHDRVRGVIGVVSAFAPRSTIVHRIAILNS